MSEEADSAVAIVGLGAVFPGAGDAPAFWRNIKAGTDAITDVTPDRWDPALYCDPGQAGATPFYTRRGGFLGELATFNPHPFGIMPASVEETEPDQLLMLRAAGAAIDDCGTLPDRERVGVIVGRGGYLTPVMTRLDQRVNAAHQVVAVLSDLLPDLSGERLAAVRAAFEERLGRDDPQDAIGLVPNFAASRLANRFDLRGPAYTVDAACASSLIAVDHAVRELVSGRCDAMLAGGVHICHHPTLWAVFTRLRVLSPAGVIRPFDAAADGTLLSEGAGAVLLKRLADARRAGDRIYAVIRGVGVSSDGRATSMLNPLVEGQELAIRRAWAAAGLDPAAPGALGLLEAHGTATPTGDKAELAALGRVFGPPSGGPAIGIGTVKSMIGHAMPAAGIAGLIKAAFAVHEGVLPPTLHVDEPAPALAGTRFAPVTHARPWDDGPVRRAAVSAFGFGGINAHLVLESEPAPAPAARGRDARARDARARAEQRGAAGNEAILRLAADSPAELSALLRAPDAELLARAAGGPAGEPADGPCRLAIVAPDARRLVLARKIAEEGRPWRGRSDIWFSPRPLLHGPEQVAFLFPGFEPGFAPRAEGVAEAFGLPELRLRSAAPGGTPAAGSAAGQGLAAHGRDGLAAGAAGAAGTGAGANGADGAVWHAVDVVTVGRLFTAALRELGITPGVLAGHSLGEWTAMVAGGMYPDIDEFIASVQPGIVELPDVVYLALGTSADRAVELVSSLADVALTHDNCPRQSVVCGPVDQIATAARLAREVGILAQTMPFRTGFHSPAYAPHVPSIGRALGGLAVRTPQVPVWSATALAPFPGDPDEVRELVLRHLVEPVRFRQLIGRLHETGIRAFVQVGPGSLTSFTDDTLGQRDYLTVATATVKRDGLAQLRRAAAALWAHGLSPRFERFAAAPGAERPAARVPAGRMTGAGMPGAAPGAVRAGGHTASGSGLAGLADRAGAAATAGTGYSGGAAGYSGGAAGAADGGQSAASAGSVSAGSASAGSASAGSVPLRLGAPVIRLAGAVEPLRTNDAPPPPVVSVPLARQPALAELNALLAETAAAAESIATALARPTPGARFATAAQPAAVAQLVPPAPAMVPAQATGPARGAMPTPGSGAAQVMVPAQGAWMSGDGGSGGAAAPGGPAASGEIRVEREFSLRTMPEVADHCLIAQPDGWPEDSDRFPIVPMTALLEIMSDAARQLAPDQVVTGFQQVRAMRWLTVAPPTRTAVRASWAPAGDSAAGVAAAEAGRPGPGRVRVTIEGYASGYVLLSGRYPAPPPADGTPLHDRRTPPVTAGELYADRWMFHGPRFAGVASVAALAANGIAGTVLPLPARGALLDSVGQLIGHWMQVMPADGQMVFPTGIGTLRLFGPQPPAGQPLDCTAWIGELTDTEMRADAEVRHADGRVWCRIEGWTNRRFSTDDVIMSIRAHPGRHGLSVPSPDGWNVAFERWRDTASRELIMRLYLNAAERAEYEQLPSPRQRRWLLGRIAAKDTVRRTLWERGADQVFPGELTVTESADGVQVIGPFRAPPVSLVLSPDVPGRPCAVAIAGSRAGLAIEAGPDGAMLLTEPGRAPLTVDVTTGTIRPAGPRTLAGPSTPTGPIEIPKGYS